MNTSITVGIILLALIVIGGIGKVATAGYHCHWIQVGQSQVCQ